MPVSVVSDGAWSLTVGDADAASHALPGHLRTSGPAPSVLDAALSVLVGAVPGGELGADPVRVTTGAGDRQVPVVLRQAVAPGDPPGTYRITLVVTAIAGF
jgi:hypothetical protein